MEQSPFEFAAPARRVYTVAELSRNIQDLLAGEFDDVWVSGEISGARVQPSGHCYFVLKDRESQIRCALFKGTMRFLKFKPQDGIAVLARGHVDVFPPRGEYQLIVEQLEPQGHGALQLAFEQLKAKLNAEGLFDHERKRALPRFPLRIGLITSTRGAVISDMLNILERRFPGLHIRLFPAAVQGEGSVEDVVRALRYFSRDGWAEVVVVARGGGSLEDLWTFNIEAVARAIATSAVPVVSAIGHETDFTIADFAADLRAPTPSAAAELLICTKAELTERFTAYERRLAQALRLKLLRLHRRVEQGGAERAVATVHRAINRRSQLLDEMHTRIRDAWRRKAATLTAYVGALEGRLRYWDVRPRLARDRGRVTGITLQLRHRITATLAGKRARWERSAARLEQLSPLRVLERGYAIVERKNGGILKDPAEVMPGTSLEIRLAAGTLEAESK